MSDTILVVDDERGIRDAFFLALKDLDYVIDLAKSGKEGVELVSKKRYDLIYIDLNMPDMDGIETLRAIRAMDNKVKVYFITAFQKEFLSRLKALDRDDISYELLKKPIKSGEIVELTADILKESKLTQQHDTNEWIGKKSSSKYMLKLYISGDSETSKLYIDELKILLHQQFNENYSLEVIDLVENPEKAGEMKIMATPTLIRALPLPVLRIVGKYTAPQNFIDSLIRK